MKGIYELPESLTEAALELLQETAPPDAKIEKWITANKPRFIEKYGKEAGERILYGKAWNMFSESYYKELQAEKAKTWLPEEEDEDCCYTDLQAKTNAQSGLPELGEEEITVSSMTEDCRVASSEPNSAVGMRESNPKAEYPKHVDVMADDDLLDPNNPKKGFRCLMQFPSGKATLVPAPNLPAAPSLEALLALSPNKEMAEAVMKAMKLPHKEPQFKGN